MGLIHTPRVLFSLVKGLVKRQTSPERNVGLTDAHIYTARAGLFDVDYLGHLNNAAYLSHAELARWEMTSHNGLLAAMMKNNIAFLVAGSAVRYRREIRPIFCRFQIETTVAGLDDNNNIWIMQNFRYPTPGQDRILAQVLIRGMAVQGRTVINPRHLFVDLCEMDETVVDKLIMPNVSDEAIQSLLEKYADLEDQFREVAALDDEKRGA
jgi:acyl-CoA thioesterase FadM